MPSTHSGRPCDADGNYFDEPIPHPPPRNVPRSWMPFDSRAQFTVTEEVFELSQLSVRAINNLLQALAAHAVDTGGSPDDAIFQNAQEIYDTIDSIVEGEVTWRTFKVKYAGPVDDDSPPWMLAEYEIHCRNTLEVVESMIASEDFRDAFHYKPYEEYTGPHWRRWSDLMSGYWCWKQAVSDTSTAVRSSLNISDRRIRLLRTLTRTGP